MDQRAQNKPNDVLTAMAPERMPCVEMIDSTR
jgi:hypothetical protein